MKPSGPGLLFVGSFVLICFDLFCFVLFLITDYISLIVIGLSKLSYFLFKLLLEYSCLTMLLVLRYIRVNQLCIYTRLPSFLDFLPISVTTEHWVQFLGYAVPSCSLSILCIVLCIYLSQSPNASHPSFSPLVSKCLFSTSVSLFLLCK